MNLAIRCTASFLKQVEALKRTGGKAARAVTCAEHICRKLNRDGRGSELFLRSKQTKHGEHRLESHCKYDLGAGYRLVCRKDQGLIVLECIGTHDAADAWINNRRYATHPPSPATCAWPETADDAPAGSEHADAGDLQEDSIHQTADLYEEALLRRADEKTLRLVFRGLTTTG